MYVPYCQEYKKAILLVLGNQKEDALISADWVTHALIFRPITHENPLRHYKVLEYHKVKKRVKQVLSLLAAEEEIEEVMTPYGPFWRL